MTEKYTFNGKWLQDLDQKDAEGREARALLVYNSVAILDALGGIAQRELDSLERTPFSDYDTPNWALKEADRKGQIRAYRNILFMTQRKPVNA